MIGLWIIAAVLTAATIGLIGLPLMRRGGGAADAGSAELEIYRDQLAELERERVRGSIDPAEAGAMEAEIGRRMLAAARTAPVEGPQGGPARRLTFILTFAIPVVAVAIYLAVGHPDLPGQPLAGRSAEPTDTAQISATADRIRAKLKPSKEFLGDWVMVGETYEKLGRARDAADALRVAAGLAPDDAALSAALAEALVQADGGTVGEEARRRFDAVPAASPARPEAQFYLALSMAQAGDTKGALAAWQSLLAESPADAPWIDATKIQIAKAARALGLDPVAAMPKPLPAATPPAAAPPAAASSAAAQGPSQADMEAASQMTPEQREQMIRGMVAKLAARLEANPDDADGWQRLARAYRVLGDADKAKDAEAKAEAARQRAGGKQ